MELADLAPTLGAALGEELADVDGAPACRPRPQLQASMRSRAAAPGDAVATKPTSVLQVGHATSSATQPRLAEGALELAPRWPCARREAAQADAASRRDRRCAGRPHDELERANRVWTDHALARRRSRSRRTASSPSSPRPTSGPTASLGAIRSVHGADATSAGRWWSSTTAATPPSPSSPRSATIGCACRRVPHGGPAAARNAAPRRPPTGAVITYLDDDNTARSGLAQGGGLGLPAATPTTDVLYGARMVDDMDRVHERGRRRDGRGCSSTPSTATDCCRGTSPTWG